MQDTDTYSPGVGEVAEAYNVSATTVRAWDRDGKLKSFRTLGNQRRFRLADNPELAALMRPTSRPVDPPID